MHALLLFAALVSVPAEITPLDPAEVPALLDRIAYERPGAALRHLDLDDAAPIREAVPGLVEAFELLVTGHPAEARGAFEALRSIDDAGAAGLATGALAHLLHDAAEYDALLELQAGLGDEPDPIVVALSRAPGQRMVGLDAPVTTELRSGVTGSPMVEAVANDVRHWMWVDTGASHTLLAESVAVRLGVEHVDGPPVSIGTSTTDQVEARVGWLPTIEVGEVRIENHAVLVVPDDVVNLSKDGVDVRVDAILGWNALRHLRVTLDHGEGRYTMVRSTATAPEAPTLFWLGYPVVRLTGPTGQPLHFGLDTGSRNTSLGATAFDKLTFGSVRADSVTVGGLGGNQRVASRVVDVLELVLADHRIRIPDVQEEPHDDAFFIHLDGILGADVLRGGATTIDYPNARFEVVPR